MPLVSIIVPVYKAEKWLHRCVDSILAQTMTDFELLLIDDGSPDKSGEICDEYAAKDNRVRVFHKENGGVSSARNLGLDNATGEWISFIDADDWVETEYLAGLTEKLDADMILGGVKMSDGSIYKMDDNLYVNKLVGNYLELYLFKVELLSPWGNLLRNDILKSNQIRFDERIHYAEDRVFNREYLLYCNSIRTISENDYNYLVDVEQIIGYVDKFRLTIEDLDYLCSKLCDLNKKIEFKFNCKLEEELRNHYILSTFHSINNLKSDSFVDFYQLCRKYYKDITIEKICSDNRISPVVIYIDKMRQLYLIDDNDDVKFIFDRLEEMCKIIPLKISFVYKDFYLWYLLIKFGWWSVFNILMRLYKWKKLL